MTEEPFPPPTAPVGRSGRMVLIFSACMFALAAAPLPAVTVDRIAAVIDRQILTVSEISQMATIRFLPRGKGQSEDDYRHEILDTLIAQALRFRDVERFGAQDIPKDSIEARLHEIQSRFDSPAAFDAALATSQLSLDEVRALIKRQLQVEAYIQERFAPMVFVSSDEIEAYYSGTWSAQRKSRGLLVPPLNDVREEIRTAIRSQALQKEIETWTTQLRAHANVDVYAWR
jgi:SurA N-terminal domain.